MKLIPIERISTRNATSVEGYFETGPAYPAVLVGATAEWPALQKWNLEFFSTNFAGELGIASLSFDRTRSGKATKLGAFIDHLDKPFVSMPGLWFGVDQQVASKEAEFDEKAVWAFNWDAFRRHRSLRDDISPYPSFIPNIVRYLSPDVAEVFEHISSVKFYAIYISRKNTITPLHTDFHHTIGSLVQFEGDKTVILLQPEAYALSGTGFEPENPDYELFPQMRDAIAYSAVLKPGEMLIIPPDWWHYTRSHDHSITLSHNFFTPRTFSSFIRCIFEDMDRHPDKQELFERIKALLGPAKAEGEPDRDAGLSGETSRAV